MVGIVKIEYPPVTMPGDTREEWERKSLNPWRMAMKHKILAWRGWKCERAGCECPAEHLDEAIITRGDMRGFSLEQRRLAFASVNLEVVCAIHNVEKAQDREGAWDRACARYGRETMQSWYESLNLRAPRHDWLPQE